MGTKNGFIGNTYRVSVVLFDLIAVLLIGAGIGALLGVPSLVSLLRSLNFSFGDCIILALVGLLSVMIQFHSYTENAHEPKPEQQPAAPTQQP